MPSTLRPGVQRVAQRARVRQPADDIRWLLLAWLLLGAVLALVLWQSHRQTDARERQLLAQQAQVLHDQLQVEFGVIYLGLGELMERLPRWQAAPGGAAELDWQLHAFQQAMVGVSALNVLNARGVVTASSHAQLVGKDFGQRDYVARLQAADSGQVMVVSEPLAAELGGQTMILSRALHDAQGHYRGAISAALDERELKATFEAVRYAPDMVSSLVHDSGKRFMTALDAAQAPAQVVAPMAGAPFIQHQRSGGLASVQQGSFQPSGALRMVALRTLASSPALPLDRPLVASVGRDWQAVFAPWRQQVVVVASAYVLTLAVAVWGARTIRRRRALVEQQREAVAHEAARLHHMLDRLLENVPGMIYQYRLQADGHSSFPYATPGVREVYGLTPQEVRDDASAVLARLHPDDAPGVQQRIRASAEQLSVWEDEYRVLLPGRGLRWLHGMAQPQQAEDGAVLWHGYIYDVTAQHQARERLDLLAENVPGMIYQFQLDPDGHTHFPYASAGALQVYGLSPEVLRADAAPVFAHIHPDDLAEGMHSIQASAQTLQVWRREYRYLLPGRGERWLQAQAKPQRLPDGAVLWHGYIQDVTQAKQQQLRLEDTERQLRQLVYVDGLTGVANRRHFDEQLQTEWRRCLRSHQPLALLMVDIDYFKLYNDHYGHQQGDACLQAVAGALKAGLGRAHDLVARYGGEEFVCLLPEIDVHGARRVAQGLCAAVQALGLAHAPSPLGAVVTVSIGVACDVPTAEGAPADLLAQADAHLYRAKNAGRNRIEAGGGEVF